MIRGIEACPDYLVADNIVEISAKSQVIDLYSNSNLDLLIKSNSYKPPPYLADSSAPEIGDRKALVESEEWTGPAFQTCADAAYISGKFETSRRREVVGFNHHREVASLPIAEADQLLDWCEEEFNKTGRVIRLARMLLLSVQSLKPHAGVTLLYPFPPRAHGVNRNNPDRRYLPVVSPARARS